MADRRTSTPPVAPPAPAAEPRAGTVRILLVEDSVVQLRFLRTALSGDEFEVVGEVRNGRDVVAAVEESQPQALLFDLDIPGLPGIEIIERVMASRPTPIVVCAPSSEAAADTLALEALAAGAVDIVAKPSWGSVEDLEAYAEDLRRRLRVASRVRVITHPRARLRPGGRARPKPVPTARAADPATTPPAVSEPAVDAAVEVEAYDSRVDGLAGVKRPLTAKVAKREPEPVGRTRTRAIELVAIGASTGGPQALAALLPALPADFGPAVLVVQHMAEGFIPGLVSWLGELCVLPVVMGQTGHRLRPGVITVAPSGLNLLVRERLRVVCEPAPARQFHVPGVDASFLTIADAVGDAALGVVLTGMGRDGALGLKAMREVGAITIGQDESTSAVYGMPAAAWQLGAVEHQLPLAEIAPLILAATKGDLP